jgi:hypothetical protein
MTLLSLLWCRSIPKNKALELLWGFVLLGKKRSAPALIEQNPAKMQDSA